MDSAAPLFAGWKKTMVRSCLQGHMGTVVTDGRTPPESALCAVGDFCFLAGRPDPELARQADRPILIPRTPDWEPVLRGVWGPRLTPFFRYALKAEPGDFDPERLAACAAALPEGYALSPYPAPATTPCSWEQAWSKDLCGNFRDGADFAPPGAGGGRPARTGSRRPGPPPTPSTTGALRLRSTPDPTSAGRGWLWPVGPS